MTKKTVKQPLFIPAVLITLFLGACSTSTKQPATKNSCPELRPEICTMQYDPVCGLHTDNTTKTYASDCTACSNKEVAGYNAGECP